jgi:hypothetical protein
MTAAKYSAYEAQRYWALHELRRVRSAVRVGNTSEANARKERRGLQRDLAALRHERKG